VALAPKQPGSFVAVVADWPDSNKLTFRWASTRGEIKGESGSSTIELHTTKKDSGANIIVFVRVEGLPTDCPDTASEIVGTVSLVEGDPVDIFAVLKLSDVKARMGNFYLSINANQSYTGLIDLYFSPRELRAARLARINTILEAVRFLKYDISKVEFAFMESEEIKTVLWLVPPDVDRADLVESRPGAVFVQGSDVMKNPQRALPRRQCVCKWK